jgi:hypothetical protein
MQRSVDIGIPAVAMGESLYSQLALAPEAAARLENAINRVREDPSDANLRELQAAKDSDAYIRFITNLGRGGAGGYASSALKWQRNPAKPSMEAAEAERSKVDALVRAAQAKAAQPAAPFLTAPAASAPPASSVAEKLAGPPTAASRRIWQDRLIPPPEL